jgi:hypothetical protein
LKYRKQKRKERKDKMQRLESYPEPRRGIMGKGDINMDMDMGAARTKKRQAPTKK